MPSTLVSSLNTTVKCAWSSDERYFPPGCCLWLRSTAEWSPFQDRWTTANTPWALCSHWSPTMLVLFYKERSLTLWQFYCVALLLCDPLSDVFFIVLCNCDDASCVPCALWGSSAGEVDTNTWVVNSVVIRHLDRIANWTLEDQLLGETHVTCDRFNK